MMAEQVLRLNSEPRSKVWRPDPPDGWVYKRQPKSLCDNEVYCLGVLAESGYVPQVEWVGVETIRTTDLGDERRVTDPESYLSHTGEVLRALREAFIRHGDLTEHSIIPVKERPMLIDFAESRLRGDPRPDKRPEGDEYWLHRTMRKQAVHNQRSPEMWAQIVEAPLDFEGKSVLDVGCGHGDMLIYAANAGTKIVLGVEHDEDIAKQLHARIAPFNTFDGILLYIGDLQHFLPKQEDNSVDIALCLSVLPYVDMQETLSHLARIARQVVIECQYKGDGPGTVQDDGEMRAILGQYWLSVRPIGGTPVKEGQYFRTLWLCEELQ